MIYISKGFLNFFEIFIFQAFRGVKGQKIAQDDKKILAVALHISETIHYMFLIMVHMCKRIIYPGFFPVGQKSKQWPEMTIMSVTLISE